MPSRTSAEAIRSVNTLRCTANASASGTPSAARTIFFHRGQRQWESVQRELLGQLQGDGDGFAGAVTWLTTPSSAPWRPPTGWPVSGNSHRQVIRARLGSRITPPPRPR